MTLPKAHASPIDPDEARRLLSKAIVDAASPVPAATLGSLTELGRKIPSAQVRDLLAESLAAGSVFLWGSKSKPAFWSQPSEDVAKDRLLRISANEILTKPVLEKRAVAGPPKLTPALVKRIQKELLAEGSLREVPAAAGSRGRRVINAQRPEAYLEVEISALLERFGVARSAERIRTLFAAEEERSQASDPARQGPTAGVREVADKIFGAMNRLAFAPGTTVTFFRLRQQPELANIPKRTFDEAALLLQAERRALLSTHDHAQALPKEEQDRFVTDGLGHFYVSIYTR